MEIAFLKPLETLVTPANMSFAIYLSTKPTVAFLDIAIFLLPNVRNTLN